MNHALVSIGVTVVDNSLVSTIPENFHASLRKGYQHGYCFYTKDEVPSWRFGGISLISSVE
jgi:hypothetical protein